MLYVRLDGALTLLFNFFAFPVRRGSQLLHQVIHRGGLNKHYRYVIFLETLKLETDKKSGYAYLILYGLLAVHIHELNFIRRADQTGQFSYIGRRGSSRLLFQALEVSIELHVVNTNFACGWKFNEAGNGVGTS